MKEETNEFSFVLKPSPHGVGVFATHAIKKGTPLRLFGDEKLYTDTVRILEKHSVPLSFQDHCIDRGELLHCPKDFGCMQIGWYLNHSKQKSNAVHREYDWYASRDISEGEEIIVDYNSLHEPQNAHDSYYTH